MKRYRRTTLIMVAALAVLAGLVAARRVHIEPAAWWLIFAPALLLLKHKNITSLTIVIILGLGIGLWRGGLFMQKLDEIKALAGQEVTIQATARSDSIYARGSQLEFTAGEVSLLKPTSKPLTGIFRVSGFGEPIVYRGDRVQISGKLYPTRGANQARISYSKLDKLGPDTSWLNRLTRKFTAGIQSALPEPAASFGLGILVGQRNTMPAEINQQLVTVGLVHIVAVSGYNLTILVRAVSRLRLGSKYQKLVLSLSLIGLFVVITGFSASIVRAAVVSSLGLWAWYYGRQARPLLVLALAAAITAYARPFYIWGDVGWYLSFLAFFGILIVAPVIVKRLFSKRPKLITLAVIETLAAEIMTLPLIMLIFGQLSLVALVANGIIVPLVPVAMLLSAVAGMGGMLVAPIAGWFAWPAVMLMTFMLDIIRLLASVPSALVHATISPVAMLVFYGFFGLVVLAATKHLKTKKVLAAAAKTQLTP
ncbi:MAG: ComEC/Rec2 family competence protein [Candidatus Saccharimonadales bacterium]